MFAAERMPKMVPRGRDNQGRTSAHSHSQSHSPKPENDHDYDDHFGDYGFDGGNVPTQAAKHLPIPSSASVLAQLAGDQCDRSEGGEPGVGISSRCILFLHCNCHLVAVGKAARNNRNYMKWAFGECAWTSVFGCQWQWQRQWLKIGLDWTMGHLECRH